MSTVAMPHPLSSMRAAASDPAVLALIVAALLVGLLEPARLGESLVFVARALAAIAPFLLLAVLVAAAAAASGADRVVARAFSGHPSRSVALASLVGALSPFCSCGVIPLVAAMLRAGVPLAPVMAFWLASPVMDPEMFILTAAGVGAGFAAAKTVAAVVLGLLGGAVVLVLQRAGALRAALRGAACGGCCAAPDAAAPVQWRFWRVPGRRARFLADARRTGGFLLKWLTLAYFVESLMIAWLPAHWVAGALGDGQTMAIPLAAVVGVPTYLNGYAAIPLIAGLLDMGMSPGAALAFATAGAVSSLPAAIAVWALVRRAVFVLYLGLGLAGATLVGIAYQASGLPV
jgi:uncharacterized membrane protein YraQ (UPF0718 family)